jgi:hypothetical protein
MCQNSIIIITIMLSDYQSITNIMMIIIIIIIIIIIKVTITIIITEY